MGTLLPKKKLSKQSRDLPWLVGIGASAGGLEALSVLVSNLPKDFPYPIVIAQHLAPHVKSMMVELLARHSSLPVVAAKDQVRLKAGTISIVPPNFDIDVEEGRALLTIAGRETRPKPSVDDFFESLARAYRDRAVGIILSGTGSDGAEGVRAIHSAGGLTIAQDDRTAKYDGMPRSAVDTGSIDHILPPDEIGRNLVDILETHRQRVEYQEGHEDQYAPVLEIIRSKCGVDFSQYKSSTIQRRITKYMSSLGAKDIKEFIDLLQKRPIEVERLSQELLVSVTSFFRDPPAFDELKRQIEKIVQAKQPGDDVRAWVAGCATGEEAYSVAMLLLEASERLGKSVGLKVFATDLDHDAIFDARRGLYSAQAIETVPPDLRQKYFSQSGSSHEVSKRLRDTVVFAKQDLAQNPPFVKIDLITCRNVLIYFETKLQKRTLEVFHYALAQGGILFLGKSEGIAAVSNLFASVSRNEKIYVKLDVPSRMLTLPRSGPMGDRSFGLPLRRQPMGPSLAERAYERIFKAKQMAAAVINEDGTVLQMMGDVSPYLGFHTGQVESKLQNLLPRGIGIEIPILIRKARNEGKAFRSRLLQHLEGDGRTFTMVVRPLFESHQSEDAKALFVVSFEARKKVRSEKPVERAGDQDVPNRMAELEQELFVTREHLQTVIEELGISNEELQSVNEELSSTNEELQASSEELETTNEELQSSNEELTTLNEQLSVKSAEMKALNASLENIQSSINAPLILLDQQKRVVRFNHDSLKIFNFGPGDVGRPITQISANCELPDFEQKLEASIVQAKVSEEIVEIGPLLYQMRILPCYDESRNIVGAILIFIDNTDLVKTQERHSLGEARLRAIIDSSTSQIFLKDAMGRYVMANRAFYEFCGLNEDQVLGRMDREIFGGEIANTLRDGELEVILKQKRSRREENFEWPAGRPRSFVMSRFPVMDAENRDGLLLGVVALEITDQVRAQQMLRESEARYRAIVEDQAVFVCRFNREGDIQFLNYPLADRFQIVEGQSFFSLIAVHEKNRVKQELLQISSEQPVVEIEHQTSEKRNAIRWVRWICRGIFTEQGGEASEYQIVGFDVTEIRSRNNQLLQKEAIYSNVFDNTLDLLSIYRVQDGELILESLNASAARGFGYISPNLVGRPLRQLLSDRNSKRILENYTECVRLKTARAFEESYHLFGDVKTYATTLVPVLGQTGEVEHIAAVSRDITENKRIEDDLRKAKEAAEGANQIKSEFLASMSHELRTPLNVVIGMSQILAEGKLSIEQQSLVETIGRSGQVLLSLIDDILDIAKIEAGKISLQNVAFSFDHLVHEVIEFFSLPAKRKNIALKFTGDSQGMVFVGDPARLRQILINLVGNAVKFTEKGMVEVGYEVKQSGLAWSIHVEVIDSGIGIARADHSRLFRRFSQLESGHQRRYGGSGLGLTICRQLVEMMGGEIGFESEAGKGSRFFFHVPVGITEKASPDSLASGAASSSATKESEKALLPLKVLVAEDNIDSQHVLELMLKKIGHDVTIVGGGDHVVEILKKDENSYDLILMDIQMPRMDGYTATGLIREIEGPNGKVPILALTANAMAGDAELCLRAGMDDYLTKPIHLPDLKSALARWSAKIYQQREDTTE